MKEKLKNAGLVLLVYTLCIALVMVVLLFAIVTASFVVWNMNLFNTDVLASVFRISVILGLVLGTLALYKGWNELTEIVNED